MTNTLLLPDEYNRAQANRVKQVSDVKFHRLKYWNYDPCEHHKTPEVSCQYKKCGGDLFSHQRVGIAWLHLIKRGILADMPGAGKTNQILGLAALLAERGELEDRMVIVAQTPSVLQWAAEAARWTPTLRVAVIHSGLAKAARIQRYASTWDILVVGNHMMLKDADLLEKLHAGTIVIDDVDAALDHKNATHKKLRRLCEIAQRSVFINATSIQTRLQQIHAASLMVGGFAIFGNQHHFENAYVRKEKVYIYGKSPNGSPAKKIQVSKVTGYKNIDTLKQKLWPIMLRRNYDDLTDIRMPEVMPPTDVWLDMHPRQRERYDTLQAGVVELLRGNKAEIKHATALTKVTYGQQICAGLAALGEDDGPGTSVKLDWLMNRLTDAWHDQKIIVYIRNVGMVKALYARLAAAGIGSAVVWGQKQNAQQRQEQVEKFWQDPNCRVMMGTSSIERSLNLQCANIVVFLDTNLNPSRNQQILGRSRRAGSKHDHVWVFNLFCTDSQESKYLTVLQARQAVADNVYEEDNALYQALSAKQLLELLQP